MSHKIKRAVAVAKAKAKRREQPVGPCDTCGLPGGAHTRVCEKVKHLDTAPRCKGCGRVPYPSVFGRPTLALDHCLDCLCYAIEHIRGR